MQETYRVIILNNPFLFKDNIINQFVGKIMDMTDDTHGTLLYIWSPSDKISEVIKIVNKSGYYHRGYISTTQSGEWMLAFVSRDYYKYHDGTESPCPYVTYGRGLGMYPTADAAADALGRYLGASNERSVFDTDEPTMIMRAYKEVGNYGE